MPKKVLIEKKRYKKKSGGKRISLILNGPSGKGGGPFPPRRLKARSADCFPFPFTPQERTLWPPNPVHFERFIAPRKRLFS